ncbi:MAG: DUF1761 domain-containing protein [Myxococcota bacterium]
MPDFPSLNWLAVIAAAFAAFVLGWLWFGPLFGRRWQAEIGLTEEQIAAGNTPKVFAIAFALNVFMSVAVAAFRVTIGITSPLMSAGFGVCVAVSFVAPVLATNYLFSHRTKTQLAIDAGYFVVMYAVIGLVQSLLGG